jgi:hypothetical protein
VIESEFCLVFPSAQALSLTLQAMGQDDENFSRYSPMAVHLVKDFFLNHDSKDVQLLVACCIADILRVFAPEAPYKEPEQIKVSTNIAIARGAATNTGIFRKFSSSSFAS